MNALRPASMQQGQGQQGQASAGPQQPTFNRKHEVSRALACSVASYHAHFAGFNDERDKTPFKPSNNKINQDAFSTKMAAKAAALYLKTNPEGTGPSFKTVNVSVFRAAGTVVLIVKDREESKDRFKTAYVAFAGVTSSKMDLFTSSNDPYLESKISSIPINKECGVHKSYLATAAVYADLNLTERLAREGFKHIIFCGHGRGGAIAHSAYLVSHNLPPPYFQPSSAQGTTLRSIAFGSPYFGTIELARSIPAELSSRIHTINIVGDAFPALMTLIQQQMIQHPDQAKRWWNHVSDILNAVVLPSESAASTSALSVSGQTTPTTPTSSTTPTISSLPRKSISSVSSLPTTSSSSLSGQVKGLQPLVAHTLNTNWTTTTLDRLQKLPPQTYTPIGQFTFLAPTITDDGFHPEETTDNHQRIHLQFERVRFESGDGCRSFSLHGVVYGSSFCSRGGSAVGDALVRNWDGSQFLVPRGGSVPNVFSMLAMGGPEPTTVSIADLWPRKTAEIKRSGPCWYRAGLMSRVKGELFLSEAKYTLEFRSEAQSAAMEANQPLTGDLVPLVLAIEPGTTTLSKVNVVVMTGPAFTVNCGEREHSFDFPDKNSMELMHQYISATLNVKDLKL
ncbi:hypothetical protein HDU76_007359 [Blyttiomyces sp. JEL0837]|nr:hypothetical protein HDU76_007359 [Blyttiomyces sp. JEL0837]